MKKKLIITIPILLLLSSCESITHKEENKILNENINNQKISIQSLTIENKKLKSEIENIENELEELQYELEERNNILEKQSNQIININNSTNKFQNNITCNTYKQTIEKDLTTNEQILELFYSESENTCIATIISSTNIVNEKGIPEIGYFKIKDAITQTSINFFNCAEDTNCYTNFQTSVKLIK